MAPEDKRGRGLGATGETARARIKELRGRTPVTEISEKLTELGRPIPPLGLRRIEDGTRRVDLDDLVALAVVLGVSPVTLLMPAADSKVDSVPLTGFTGALTAEQLWEWLTANRPLPQTGQVVRAQGAPLTDTGFFARALPLWEQDRKREESRARIDTLLQQLGVAASGDDK